MEREGYLSSSDAGASFHYNLPSNFGDVHVGYYNGENYNRAEVNDQKAVQIRGTVRPFATRQARVCADCAATSSTTPTTTWRTASGSGSLGAVTYEHAYVNAGFDYLDADDQTLRAAWQREGRRNGYSIWVNPRTHRTDGRACCATTTSRRTIVVARPFDRRQLTTTLIAGAQPDDCRHRVLVPASGHGRDGAAPRLRRSDVRQLYGRYRRKNDRRARADQLLG